MKKKSRRFGSFLTWKKTLKIRISLVLTFKTQKNARPRIFYANQVGAGAKQYPSLNSAMLSCSTEVTLVCNSRFIETMLCIFKEDARSHYLSDII